MASLVINTATNGRGARSKAAGRLGVVWSEALRRPPDWREKPDDLSVSLSFARRWPLLGIELGFGWPRDREDLAYMLGPHLAKGCGVAWQRPPLVPQHGQWLAQRSAPVGQAKDIQIISMRPEGRGNDGYAVSGFGEGEQGMRRAAL